MSLGGRHALVTGGGRGIGRAIAHALTAAGARVTVTGRSEAPLIDTVAPATPKVIAPSTQRRRPVSSMASGRPPRPAGRSTFSSPTPEPRKVRPS